MWITLAILLTANICIFGTWFAKDIWVKISYLFYSVKSREQVAAVVHTTPKPRDVVAQNAINDPKAQIIRPLSPQELKRRKAQEFRAKNM